MNIFDKSPKAKLPYSRFDLSHSRKFSMKFGTLVPLYFEEAVPGDKVRMTPEILGRMAPMISPAYARVKVKIEHFFIAKRILCDEYDTFRTGGEDGMQAPVMPHFNPADITSIPKAYFAPGTYWDFLGLPCIDPLSSNATPISCPDFLSALPFRAIQRVYNEWYRIPGLTHEWPEMNTTSGQISSAEATALIMQANELGSPENLLCRRAWERDYFTSAQPDAQRGGAAAAPIDIVYHSVSPVANSAGGPAADGPLSSTGGILTDVGGGARIENIGSASVLAESIRLAEKVQQFLEAMQRGGSRYVDFLFQIFRRKSQDSRLQRPEFLGGHTGNFQISEVLSTVQFEGTTELPQGNMAGHGIHVGHGGGFSYTAPEDGYFLSFISIVPEGGNYGAGMSSGIPKLFQRRTRFDEYIPHFAHLGEQPVLTGELSTSLELADIETQSKTVFGYVPRYSEFKWHASSVHGDFRSTLDFWHIHRGFTPSDIAVNNPTLNNNFLTINDQSDELNRIFAVEQGDHFWILAHNNVSALRPIPYNPIPSN